MTLTGAVTRCPAGCAQAMRVAVTSPFHSKPPIPARERSTTSSIRPSPRELLGDRGEIELAWFER